MYSKKLKVRAVIAILCLCLTCCGPGRAIVGLIRKIYGNNEWVLGIAGLCFCVLLIVGVVLAIKTRRAARVERREDQERRDKLAQQLAAETELAVSESIVHGSPLPFVLYLRPFCLETTLRERRKEIGLFGNLLLGSGKMNFDFLLQADLKDMNVLLVSIGVPNEKEGAGRIVTTDASWRDRFRKLAQWAMTIVVVPGMQAGILAEIRWLPVSGLLVNSIFFKPKGYPRGEWERMKDFYEQEEEIEFPDYSRRQLSFRMYSSGICHDISSWKLVFSKNKKKRGRNQMRALLTNKPDEP